MKLLKTSHLRIKGSVLKRPLNCRQCGVFMICEVEHSGNTLMISVHLKSFLPAGREQSILLLTRKGFLRGYIKSFSD